MMDMAGKAGSKFTYEVRVARPDGRIVYALVTGTPRLRGGKVVGSITVVTDVTESKKAQEALRSSELRFRTMVQRHQAAMFLVDEHGEIVDANSAAEMLYGYPRDALRGMMIGALTGEPLEQVLDAIRPKDEAQRPVVLPGKLADGRVRQVEVYSSPIEYGEGELLFLIVHDVTERETAQDALRESEERYRELVELSPEPIVVHSEVEVVYANPAAVRLLGASGLDEVIGKRLLDFVHPDSREDYVNRRRQFEGAAEPEHTGAFRLQRIDGRARDIEFASGPIQLLGQRACQVVIRDVTESRRAEAALRESEAQLRTLVEYAPEAIVVFDVEARRFAHVNENAVRMFGYSRSELRRMGPGELSPPNQPDGTDSEQHIREQMRLTIAGETPVFEWVHRNAAGEDIPCEIHLVRMPATGRTLIRGSITDITERKRLEEQLMQSQKMEAIGRLAGGIAHDFNNLTTAILGYGELTLEEMGDDDPLKPNLEQIQKAAGRAADLTRQLLAFARKQLTQPKVIILNDLVTNLEEMLRRFTGEDVEFVSILAPDLHPVRVDPGQFEQVLLNLVVNGRDAMPQGGRLTIETSNVLVDSHLASQHPPMIPGPYVLLRVSDSGIGMDDKVIKYIFEPFFTTKPRTKGTGLGLATCYGIVKQAAGYIWATSKPNAGASFSIYLPREEEAPVPAAVVAQTEGPSAGAESVLLVEDELMVMEMVEKILRAQGYRVITASGGEEALAVAKDMNGEIDLLLTDVVMPRMSGGELARTLVAQHPDLKILFMSGYTEDAAVHQGRLEHGADFLQKPFSPRVLADRVRTVLDSQFGDEA
jgi:PAS domain S-box-containing protein